MKSNISGERYFVDSNTIKQWLLLSLLYYVDTMDISDRLLCIQLQPVFAFVPYTEWTHHKHVVAVNISS